MDCNKNSADALKLYEGRDPYLLETPVCQNCRATTTKTGGRLLKCGRCKFEYYCSRECQRSAYESGHKKICRKIESFAREQEAVELRAKSYGIHIGGPDRSFLALTGTREYMRARSGLMDALTDLAARVGTVELWEEVVRHIYEMLRLFRSDILGLRFKLPFVLLNLNRDDDAYAFIVFTCTSENHNYAAQEGAHAQSKKGDWLYQSSPAGRYNNIFDDVPDFESDDTRMWAFVALAIIKMRVIATHEAQCKSYEILNLTRSGCFTAPASSALYEMITGDPKWHANMESQREQLNRIFDIIDRCNPTMLAALCYPDPLLSKPYPDHEPLLGTPSESYVMLKVANIPWQRIPGAREVLTQRFGTHKPIYDTETRLPSFHAM